MPKTPSGSRSIRFPNDLWEQLAELAASQDRAPSNMVVALVREALANTRAPRHPAVPSHEAAEVERLLSDFMLEAARSKAPIATVGAITVVDRDEVRAKLKASGKPARHKAPIASPAKQGRLTGYASDGSPIYR